MRDQNQNLFEDIYLTLQSRWESEPASSRSQLLSSYTTRLAELNSRLLEHATERDEQHIATFMKQQGYTHLNKITVAATQVAPQSEPDSEQRATVVAPVSSSSVRAKFAFLTAPSELPLTFSRWNTISVRLLGVARGIWIHQTGDQNVKPAVVAFIIAQLGIQLVMFGVLPPSISGAVLACFLLILPLILMQYNLDLLQLVVVQFDFVYVAVYMSFSYFWLLPDLCGWDVRSLQWFGAGALAWCALLSVDAQTTPESAGGSHKGWSCMLCCMVLTTVCVQKQLYHDLRPRLLDIGVTVFSTQSLLVTCFVNVILFGLKFLMGAILAPGQMCIIKAKLRRPEMSRQPRKLSPTTDNLRASL